MYKTIVVFIIIALSGCHEGRTAKRLDPCHRPVVVVSDKGEVLNIDCNKEGLVWQY